MRKRFFPKALALALLLLAAAGLNPAGAAARRPKTGDTVKVTVVQTTDVHARILPWDYLGNKPANVGLAKAAAYARRARSENPNLILIDNGDTLQGTPLGYYFALEDSGGVHPMIAVMNAMGYDAMTVGNHEYNFGLAVLERCERDARFPFLSANTYRTGQAEPRFKPYIVKEFNGARIGILGLTTPAVPGWELPENYAGLEFRSTVEEARKWVRVLREKEHVDAVIVNTHEGYEADLDTGQINDSAFENQAYKMLQEVDGIDVLLTGHAHRHIEPRRVRSAADRSVLRPALTAQGYRWAEYVIRIDLEFQRENGRWKLARTDGQSVAMNDDVAPDPEITALARTAHETVMRWLDSRIGAAGEDFTTDTIYVEDNPLLDLVHTAVREATGAQMSLLSYLPGRYITLPRGPLTIRDIYKFYFYENTAVKLVLKGRDIRAAIEHAAEFYDPPRWDPEAGRFTLAPAPDFRMYNYSTLGGASYAIDPSRPPGQRITHFTVAGRPVDPDAEYTLAVSNYTAAGGGRYDMMKRGRWEKIPVRDIRALVIDYVRKHGTVYPACDYNWYLAVPCRLELPNRR
jgi:2',3'-cyclic-nucleotide 2'-phosphodiesterase/3'-nucleotidase